MSNRREFIRIGALSAGGKTPDAVDKMVRMPESDPNALRYARHWF